MSDSSRKLKLKFAGRMIDLLGQDMYGGPVPSVAELIANAWDADAKKVEVTIPEVLNQSAEIKVRDFGDGMTFEELNNFYLNIGYERRKIRGDRTQKGRLVMGRKGIGKLAGFGIAEDIVLTSVKNGHLVEFVLNYDKLRALEIVEDIDILLTRDENTNEPSGVTVTFQKLKIKKNIGIDAFTRSMSRRFSIASDEMSITINGTEIGKEQLEFEYKVPVDGERTENIPGFGDVTYWYGFLNETIKDAELRGVSVFARKRIAQTPFFFNLSGGINGQVALEYLTGQVKAETLDETTDHIATHRQSVNWQLGNAPILEKWGQEKIKEWCKEWKKRHELKKTDAFKNRYTDLWSRIDGLPIQEKKDISAALEKVASIERINEDDFKVIANSMLFGVERESVKKVISRINTANAESLPELVEAIKEWDIISAVSVAEVISGKIAIIDQFKKLIDNKTVEKGRSGTMDMQSFIKNHPWLLGHEYEQLQPKDISHERGTDKWIDETILEVDKEAPFNKEPRDKGRFDLVVIQNDLRIVVLELMRPGDRADYDHLIRLDRYVTKLSSAIKSSASQTRFKSTAVYGLLIADNIYSDPSLVDYLQRNQTVLEFTTWKNLFYEVSSRYKDYMVLLKSKAPDDPRIKGLNIPE